MRKKKWKKIIIVVASIIVVLGIGGLFAANYAVDKLISTLAADLENDLLVEDEGAVDTPVSEDVPTETEKDVDESDVPNKNEPKKDVVAPRNEEKPNEGYNGEVSIDKAKDLQGKITVSEKAKVTSVLLKELSASDMKSMQELASGGLSLEEKKQARSIILDKLSAEQYDDLIQIAKKYGMSQGKGYDEVVKEK